MADYRGILRRVGFAWLAFGLADIAFLIYCIANDKNYSSSFNIFAVIAGIFLIRGSLAATRLVTWFAAFMLTGFVGAIFVLLPFMPPAGLVVLDLKLNPVSSIALCLLMVFVLALLGWTYQQLRAAPVVDALRASGRRGSAPKLAFALGLALVVFLAVMLQMTLKGPVGAKAIDLARQKAGPGYNYAVQSIQWAGDRGKAVVAAYNDAEIKYVPVEWNE